MISPQIKLHNYIYNRHTTYIGLQIQNYNTTKIHVHFKHYSTHECDLQERWFFFKVRNMHEIVRCLMKKI